MNRKDIYIRIAVAFFLILVLVIFTVFEPDQLSITECRFKSLTGLSCPTCGVTRSIYAALHFNFIDSIFFNPFGLLIFISATLFLIKLGYELAGGKSIQVNFLRKKHFWIGIFSLWGSYWLLRLLTELFGLYS